jgi:hypothetical protein
VSRIGYSQDVRQSGGGAVRQIVLADGHTIHIQAFSQSRVDVGRLSITAGAHLQHLALIGETTLEPRAGLIWRAGHGRTVSLAYGLHAQREVLSIYFAHPANRDLRMTRAHHIVGAFSTPLAADLTLTVEGYVQELTRVPVVPGTPFSTLNLELDWFVRDRLANDGGGRNTGVEVTLERTLSQGWYGILTGTVFDSRYRGGDGVWRPTRFDRGAAGSLLAGREWTFRGTRATRQLGVNGRLNVMGGRRYTPVDNAASSTAGDVIYDDSRAFSLREPPVVYADVTAEYRVNRSRSATIWSLQIINLTGYAEFYGHRFNLRDRRVEEDRETIVLPNLSATFQW